MSRLQAMYQEMILEHNKKPRHFGVLEGATHISHGKNPLCGDDYMIYCRVVEDIIESVTFDGCGCAISKSSGSLMTTHCTGKKIQESLVLKDLFLKLVTDLTLSPEEMKQLGSLRVFEGVKAFPVRVKCAALVWRALEDALEAHSGEVSTE